MSPFFLQEKCHRFPQNSMSPFFLQISPRSHECHRFISFCKKTVTFVKKTVTFVKITVTFVKITVTFVKKTVTFVKKTVTTNFVTVLVYPRLITIFLFEKDILFSS